MSGVTGRDKKRDDGAELTRKEKRAAIRAGLMFYAPRFLLVIGCFTLVGLLMWLWLR